MFKKLLAAMAVTVFMASSAIAGPVKALDVVQGEVTEFPIPNQRSEFTINDGVNIYDLVWEGTHAPLWLSTGDIVKAVGTLKKDVLTISPHFVAGSQLVEVPAVPTASDERSALVVSVDLKGPHGSISSISYLNAIYKRAFWQSANGEAGTDDNLSVDNFFRVATLGQIAFPEYMGRAATVSIKAPKFCTFDAYVDAVGLKLAQQDLFYDDFDHVVIFVPLQRYTNCPEAIYSTKGGGVDTEFILSHSSRVTSIIKHLGLNLGLTGSLTAEIDGTEIIVNLD